VVTIPVYTQPKTTKEPPISKPYVVPKPATVPKPSPEKLKTKATAIVPSPETEFIALSEYKDAQIELEQLTIHTQLNEEEKARKITLYLINNHVGKNVPSKLGTCVLVREEAFVQYRSLLKDNETRVPELRGLINDVYDPLITIPSGIRFTDQR
jgi:hypothetical protein